MLRIIVYCFIVGAFLFVPFSYTIKEEKKILLGTNTPVYIKLITPSKKKRIKPHIKKTIAVKKRTKQIKKNKPLKKIEKKVLPREVLEPKLLKIAQQEVPRKLVEKAQVNKKIQNVQTQQIATNKSIEDKYYTQLYKTIDANKRYPKKAIRFKQQDEIVVSFAILEDGKVTLFKILKQSKYNSLNKEIRRMFQKIKMFEKPPKQLQTPLEIKITISFKLK